MSKYGNVKFCWLLKAGKTAGNERSSKTSHVKPCKELTWILIIERLVMKGLNKPLDMLLRPAVGNHVKD